MNMSALPIVAEKNPLKDLNLSTVTSLILAESDMCLPTVDEVKLLEYANAKNSMFTSKRRRVKTPTKEEKARIIRQVKTSINERKHNSVKSALKICFEINDDPSTNTLLDMLISSAVHNLKKCKIIKQDREGNISLGRCGGCCLFSNLRKCCDTCNCQLRLGV